MDFTPDPEQQAVADVVDSVLGRENSWQALVSGGVTVLGVPERLGGDGVGLPEIATALTEIGRHGLISPALATLGLGLLPILDLASEPQQDRFLDGVAKGAILTAALNEPGTALPERLATQLRDGRLNGVKVVDYVRGSPLFKSVVARSKFEKNAGFGLGGSGPLLLQDHRDEVHFRSLKVRELR